MKAGSQRHGVRINKKTGKPIVVRTSRKPSGIVAKLVDKALKGIGR